jgi:hypothetical protein
MENRVVGQFPVKAAGHLRPDYLRTQIANLRNLETMKRVVIVGREASGKSTLARRLGHITGLPATEVDRVFWQSGLIATPREQWLVVQEKLVVKDRWILWSQNRQFVGNLLIASHFEELVAFLLAVVAASVVVSLPIRPAVPGCIHKHQSPGTH